MKAIVPLTYAGPIHYFVFLAKYDQVYLEKKEHFIKQSYRNRCSIVGAQGELVLTIPSHRKSRERTLYDLVTISNETLWQALHWKSICTAYRSSPYFEFYEPYFEKLYLKSYDNLYDFNLDLLKLIMNKLGLSTELIFTDEFHKSYPFPDLRPFSAPKNKIILDLPRYIQVFEQNTGFVPDLSIYDLLFNEGPAAKSYLINAAKLLIK